MFGTIDLDREFVLDPGGVADVTKSYLLVTTSHDGSGSVTGGRTPVRVSCQNTLNVAMKGISQKFSFRHTMTVAQRMEKGAEEWRRNNVYFDRFEAEAKTLFETSVTDAAFNRIVADLFPVPEADVKGAATKRDKQVEKVNSAWNGAHNSGIRNTAWGVANVLTEANQWGRGVQSNAGAEERFLSAGIGLDGPTNAYREQAFEIARSLV